MRISFRCMAKGIATERNSTIIILPVHLSIIGLNFQVHHNNWEKRLWASVETSRSVSMNHLAAEQAPQVGYLILCKTAINVYLAGQCHLHKLFKLPTLPDPLTCMLVHNPRCVSLPSRVIIRPTTDRV